MQQHSGPHGFSRDPPAGRARRWLCRLHDYRWSWDLFSSLSGDPLPDPPRAAAALSPSRRSRPPAGGSDGSAESAGLPGLPGSAQPQLLPTDISLGPGWVLARWGEQDGQSPWGEVCRSLRGSG